jgi:hypothetical protein
VLDHGWFGVPSPPLCAGRVLSITADAFGDADVSKRHTDVMKRRRLQQRGSAASGAGAGGAASEVGDHPDVLPTDPGRFHVNTPTGTTRATELTTLHLMSDVFVEDHSVLSSNMRAAWRDASSLLQHHDAHRRTLSAQGGNSRASLFTAVRAQSSSWASWNLMCVSIDDHVSLTGRTAPLGARLKDVSTQGDAHGDAPAGSAAASSHPLRSLNLDASGDTMPSESDRTTSDVSELLEPALTCYRDHMAGNADEESGDVPRLAACVKEVVTVRRSALAASCRRCCVGWSTVCALVRHVHIHC